MSAFEVEQPILNSPFEEPAEHWQIEEGQSPKRLPAPAIYRADRADAVSLPAAMSTTEPEDEIDGLFRPAR